MTKHIKKHGTMTDIEHIDDLDNQRSQSRQTVQREVRSGLFGLRKKTVSELANPELYEEFAKADIENTKTALSAFQYQIASKAKQVKEQWDIRLKHEVACYAQDLTKVQSDRLTRLIEECNKAQIDFEFNVAKEMDQAFVQVEDIKSDFLKKRIMSSLMERTENLFTTFDNHHRHLLETFNSAAQLMKSEK